MRGGQGSRRGGRSGAGRGGAARASAAALLLAAGCLEAEPTEATADDDSEVGWPEDDDSAASDDDTAGDDDSAASDDDTAPTTAPWPEPDPVLGIVTVVRWPADPLHAEEAWARAIFVDGWIDARFHDPAYQICGTRVDTDDYYASYTYPNLGWYGFWDGSLWDPEGAEPLDVGVLTIAGESPLAVMAAEDDEDCHLLGTSWQSAPLSLEQEAWGLDYDLVLGGGEDVGPALAADAVSLGAWFVPTSHATDDVHAVPLVEPLVVSWAPVDTSPGGTMLLTLIGPTDTLLGRVEDTGSATISAQDLAVVGPGDATLLLARERETRVELPEGPVVVRARLEYWLYLVIEG